MATPAPTTSNQHSTLNIDKFRGYAERSKTWVAEGRTEDVLLQRIWNLSDDVLRLIEQYEGVCTERDEFERQRNYDYTRFSETKKALLESEAEKVRLFEQYQALREVARDFIVNESLQVTSGRWYALAEALLPEDIRKQDLVNDDIIAYLADSIPASTPKEDA